MGNTPCTIAVQTDQTTYAAGSTVHGKVYVSITEPNGVSIGPINISFHGEEKTVVQVHVPHTDNNEKVRHHNRVNHPRHHHQMTRRDVHGHGGGYRLETDSSPIFHLDVPIHSPLHSSNGKMSQGQYEFPFQVVVPEFAPSSMSFSSRNNSHCQVRYNIHAYAKNSGRGLFTNTISSSKHYLNIIGGPAQTRHNRVNGPISLPEEIQHVRYFCCINKGSVTLESNIDNDVLVPLQSCNLNYAITNNSTVDIRGVDIVLKEHIDWKAWNHEESTNQDIVKISHSYTAGANNIMGRHSNNDVEQYDASLLFHKDTSVNSSSSGCQQKAVQLLIPPSAHETYSGNLIKIHHSVLIVAKTDCCLTNPESCVEVSVSQHSPTVSSSAQQLPSPYNPEAEEAGENMTLPKDWSPITADVTVLPMATAIGEARVVVDDYNVTTAPSAPFL